MQPNVAFWLSNSHLFFSGESLLLLISSWLPILSWSFHITHLKSLWGLEEIPLRSRCRKLQFSVMQLIHVNKGWISCLTNVMKWITVRGSRAASFDTCLSSHMLIRPCVIQCFLKETRWWVIWPRCHFSQWVMQLVRAWGWNWCD